MKLARLVLDGVRGVPDGDHDLVAPRSRAPLDLVLVTGPGASGKSSWLDAIAAVKESVGPYAAPPDPAAFSRRGVASGRIEATWHLSDDEVGRAQLDQSTWVTSLPIGRNARMPRQEPGLAWLLAQYFHEPTCGKFELFPANRRLVHEGPPRGAVPPLSERAEARCRLGRAPDKYACVRPWLVDLGLADVGRIAGSVAGRGVLLQRDVPDSLAPVKRAIAAFVPHLRMTGVEPRGTRHAVIFQRDDGSEVELEALSDSEQQAVLFAAVFHRIALSHSIVLIDQPELFFHPDDHARVLRVLTTLGHGNQIIAATTSERILHAAASHQIVRLPPSGMRRSASG